MHREAERGLRRCEAQTVTKLSSLLQSPQKEPRILNSSPLDCNCLPSQLALRRLGDVWPARVKVMARRVVVVGGITCTPIAQDWRRAEAKITRSQFFLQRDKG